MAKRVADRELTKDNWDEDEENEQEAGKFMTATQEDLSKRKIIKARRRITGDKKEGPTKSPTSVFQGFKGFAGFSGKTSSDPFGSKSLPGLGGFAATNPAAPDFTTMTSSTGSTSSAFSGFSGLAASNVPKMAPPQIAHVSIPTFNGNSSKKTPSKATPRADNENSEVYLDSIKALNQGVSDWIQKHVTENPYIDLTPVFDDYHKHLKEIESKASSESPVAVPLASSVSPPGVKPKVTFGIAEQKEDKSATSPIFGVAKPAKEERQPFAGLAAFSSAQSSAPTAGSSQENNAAEDTDAPPKPVSVVTAEEGSHYSIKCKLFFKRDASWSELGIGMLNFKTVSDKTQLLIRADTATGKILLNIFLSSSMPISRSGKNNVMLVAMPNPPIFSKPSEGDNTKPAPFLIRVKTAENADELYEKMKSYQSS